MAETLHEVIDDIHQSLDVLKAQKEELEKVKEQGAQTDARLSEVEARIAELKEATEKAEQDYRRILERAMWLDQVQPRHDKVYKSRAYSRDPRSRQLRREVVEYFLDIAHYRMTGRPLVNGELFRAQTVASDGGALVPTEHAREIIAILDSYGLVRQRARRFDMTSDKLTVPTGDVPTVSWQGTENTTVAESSAAFTPVTLDAKRALAINTLSLDIQADSTPSIVDYLIDVYAIAMAKEEDSQGLAGNGSPFTGILNDTNVASVTGAGDGLAPFTFDGEVTYDKLVDLQDAVNEALVDRGVFVGSRKVVSAIMKIKDTQGRPIFITDPESGVGNILGSELVRSSVAPTSITASGDPVMLFGDFRHLAFGDREQLSIELSAAAGWTTASVVMRLTERVAMAVLSGSAFAKLVAA